MLKSRVAEAPAYRVVLDQSTQIQFEPMTATPDYTI